MEYRRGQQKPIPLDEDELGLSPIPEPGGEQFAEPAEPAPPVEPPVEDVSQPDTGTREQEVNVAVTNLQKAIVGLADSIYQMKLTEEQLKELSSAIIKVISDDIGDITIERVKELCEEKLISEARKRFSCNNQRR